MLYEIRNYHFNPDLLEAYKVCAKAEAIPHLSQKLEVLGFWVNTNDAPEISDEPLDKLGSANFMWIFRWGDLAHRNDVMPRALSIPEFYDTLSRVPGGADDHSHSRP